ncbi:MAG: UDP-3-O-acyl-N-acetylglucosamine deacetylase [Candidatus Margulisbacteria bacterium]|nr:UDP-3-O-acyl-N-acetylglucosamine deacetylase [Candidatus Margulisiibacteriota bacterium]
MHTLQTTVRFSGIGLHSGEPVQMAIQPSTIQGVRFHVCMNSLHFEDALSFGATTNAWHPPVPVSKAAIGQNHLRATTLTNGFVTVQTPEHFLAACYALQLSHVDVFLSQSELPILDGSAIGFLNDLGPKLTPVDAYPVPELAINDAIDFTCNGSSYHAGPSSDFSISIMLTYPNHWVKTMTHTYHHSLESFTQDIAPARTYGFTHEIEHLKQLGLAKGGSTDNALVVSEDGYLNQSRFDNELARHKILDFIGDMAIGGKIIRGHFVLIRPSHKGNCEFLKQL